MQDGRGRQAVLRHGLPPYVNGRSRREPDFEHRAPAITASSRGRNFAPRLHPGEVEITLPFRDDLTQQHSFLHAATVTAIADSACGYAAFSLMTAEQEVLSVEFKVNLLTPAAGERFHAVGRVVRPGRTLTVCAAEVRAEQGTERTLVAVM